MRKTLKRILCQYGQIALGIIMVALAVSVFYTPNRIISGGVSGIATILYHKLGINQGISLIGINIVLLIVSYRVLGEKFVLNTIGGAALLSALVEVFSYLPPATNDRLLASVFGSVLYGLGIGLALVNGATTGGTDILARLIQERFPRFKIGSMLLIVDISVIFLSLITFGQIDLVLYGIIALFLSSFSINMLIKKLNISKLTFIVSDKGEEISNHLISHSPRGVTIIHAKGGYTKDSKTLLLCALKASEIEMFQKRILEIDPSAFIIFSESSQIVGNGYRVYK